MLVARALLAHYILVPLAAVGMLLTFRANAIVAGGANGDVGGIICHSRPNYTIRHYTTT
jgi:hypothetical protein